jgi:hypothetical protein
MDRLRNPYYLIIIFYNLGGAINLEIEQSSQEFKS